MANSESPRHHHRPSHLGDTPHSESPHGAVNRIEFVDPNAIVHSELHALNHRPSGAELINQETPKANKSTVGLEPNSKNILKKPEPVREQSDIELDAEAIESILTVYDHMEKFIRNEYKRLPEAKKLAKLDAAMSSKALRKYVQAKDEMDGILRKSQPGLKPWYER